MTDSPSPAPQADKPPTIDSVVAMMSESTAAPEGIPEKKAPAVDTIPADTPTEDSEAGAASEADQAETDSEVTESDDTAAEAPDEGEAEHVYSVKVDGEEREIPASELIKGYQLEAASRKRMDEATAVKRQAEEQQRQLQAEAARIGEVERSYQDRAKQYDAVLAQLQGVVSSEESQWAKVDWDRLESEDPVEFGRLSGKYTRFLEKKRAVEGEQSRRQQEQQAEQQQAVQAAQVNLRNELGRMFPNGPRAPCVTVTSKRCPK